MDVQVYDENLQRVGIVRQYKSLIWASRYVENGDCEVYVQATEEYVDLLREGRYLIRFDDETVCRIDKVELQTDPEDGDYLTVQGTDVKSFCDQRILWTIYNNSGNVESFVRLLVADSLISSSITERNLIKPNGGPLLHLGTAAGFTQTLELQASYKNLGEKIREICKNFGWGFRIVLDGSEFSFEIYEGTDRSNYIRFTPQLNNIAHTKYIDDRTNLGNLALIGGEGEGADRMLMTVGVETGVDRWEKFIDAKSRSKKMKWSELEAAYPTEEQGGSGQIVETPDGKWGYFIFDYTFVVAPGDLEQWIVGTIGSEATFVTIDGVRYCTIRMAQLATLESGTPEPSDDVTLDDLPYYIFMANAGTEELTKYGEIESFEGEVIPNVTFKYKQDYFLGDIVTVSDAYGIGAVLRLIEVVEVWDTNGYRLEPKFEKISLI